MEKDGMYEPNDAALAQAIRYGETIRATMVNLAAFDAACAMRDLLALAYKERQKRIDDSIMAEAIRNEPEVDA